MNKLGVIAIAGIAISTVSLGIAVNIAVKSGQDFDWSWLADDNGFGSCKTTGETANRRTLDWDDSDEVSVSIPVNLHYTAGQGTQLVMTGDPELLSHVRVEDGAIKLNCSATLSSHKRIDVTLPGNKTFREIDLKGVGDVDFHKIDQPELEVNMAGAGDVTVDGKTEKLSISTAGRGDIHAKDLIAQVVEIDIAGHGDVETSPIESADISIAGHGDVKLYTEPKHVETSIMGSGSVEHMATQK